VEVEYIGTSDAAKEVIWISSLFTPLTRLDDYLQEILSTTKVYDVLFNFSRDPKSHEHIGIRNHFVGDACERNATHPTYVPPIITKSLS